MRGRRVNAVDQETRGNPGRKRKPAKVSVADRLRDLASAAPAGDGPLDPPAVLGLEEFAGAIRVWNEIAPTLRQRNLLDRIDRHTLAMYCYYVDQFWSAVTAIAERGEEQKVRTVSGSYMLRRNPALDRRDKAAAIVLDLAKSFGLTPLDRHRLIREMAGAGAPVGGLFGDALPEKPQDTPSDGILGFAGRHGLAAGSKPN